ncbi:MAG TPA: DUF58 domain-containing protein [Mycobacteriales bacterium]|nr:DUF58 domain-containing protein [Mycobacteriales bacterium]
MATRARAGVGPALATITALGWGVLLAGAVAYILGEQLGWHELLLAASACVLVVVLAAGFAIGRSGIRLEIRLTPRRVTVGDPSLAELVVDNVSERRLLPLRIEVPVGATSGWFDVPSLAPGESHREAFVVPTTRRSVIAIGPAQAVRGDPLGLIRRQTARTDLVELFVHPRITVLDPLSAGLLRDLEGQTTNDLSANDMAFHTLRDYVAGDDWRHVHWRSSAKADRLLVRQFLDTRRSRLAVLLDADRASYADDDEFELAVSVAGSVAVAAARSDREIAVIAGRQTIAQAHPHLVLDALARVELGDSTTSLRAAGRRSIRVAPDITVAVMVTGSGAPFNELRATKSWFGPDVACVAVRVEPDAPASLSASGGITVMGVRALEDLRRLLASAVRP